MPKTLLTDIAEAKIAAAAGSAAAVSISHIALGDANGVNYNPDYAQTGLRRERARKAIDLRHLLGDNSWRVTAEFDPDTPAFPVREIGFFDGDGDLIAIWAGTDVEPRQTGAVSYLVDHILKFNRAAAEAVIVKAPDDKLFTNAVLHLGSAASRELRHINLKLKLRRHLAGARS